MNQTAVLGGIITPHKRVSFCIHRFDAHASAVRSRNSMDSLVRLQVHALLLPRVLRDPLSSLRFRRVRRRALGPCGTSSSLEKRRRRTYFENVVSERSLGESGDPCEEGGFAKGLQ